MQRQGTKPDLITHNAVTSASENDKTLTHSLTTLLDRFETMQRQGAMPDAITYNALDSACDHLLMLSPTTLVPQHGGGFEFAASAFCMLLVRD